MILPFFTSRFPPCSLKHELSKLSPGGLCHRRSGSYSWNTTNRIERMDHSWQVEGGPLDMWNDYPYKCLLRRIIQLNSLWIMTISSVTHGFLLLKRFMPPRIITSEWYPESRFGACFPCICLRIKPYLQGLAILLSTASPVYQTWLSNLTCCLGLLSTLPPTTRTRKMVVGNDLFVSLMASLFPTFPSVSTCFSQIFSSGLPLNETTNNDYSPRNKTNNSPLPVSVQVSRWCLLR